MMQSVALLLHFRVQRGFFSASTTAEEGFLPEILEGIFEFATRRKFCPVYTEI